MSYSEYFVIPAPQQWYSIGILATHGQERSFLKNKDRKTTGLHIFRDK